MKWFKNLWLSYVFWHVFNWRTVEQGKTWLNPSDKVTTSFCWTLILIRRNIYEQVTVKDILQRMKWIFSRLNINQQVYFSFCHKDNRSSILTLNFWGLEDSEIGNMAWGILLSEYPPISGPITCEPKYLRIISQIIHSWLYAWFVYMIKEKITLALILNFAGSQYFFLGPRV